MNTRRKKRENGKRKEKIRSARLMTDAGHVRKPQDLVDVGFVDNKVILSR